MSKANPAFLYPPSRQKALRHRRANQIFKGLTPSDRQTCECCNRKIGSSPFSPSCTMNPDQFSFLGPGIPLFFYYLRTTILMMLGISVLFSIFAAYTNYITNDCTTLKVCSDNTMNLFALINKKSSQTYFQLQACIELASIVAVILFLQWARYNARKLERQCDELIDSPSDYAVILRRLPPGTTEKDIEEMVQQRRNELTQEQRKITENLKIVKIILSYSLREYLSVNETNAQNFKIAIKNNQHQQFIPQTPPQPTIPSSIAIIIFQHQSSKNFFIHIPTVFQRVLQAFCTPCIPISSLRIRNNPIGVQRAPQPDDICWENSGITMRGAIGRKILYGSLAIVILILGGAAQYGLEVLYNLTSDPTLQAVLTISNSFVVLLFNSIIMITLIVTTKKQRNQTLTEYQSVLMTKQTIFQFFNAGLFVVGAEVAAQNQRFSLNDGICLQISAIMLANCFVPSLTLIFLNYTEIYNKFFIFLGEIGCIQYTQKELNQLFLGPAVDLPSKYAYILKIVWLTGLYAPLVPLVTVVAVLGLSLNYLLQKILFTKSYSLPNTVSSQTYENALQLLQYFGVTFAMGQLIAYFYFYSYQTDRVPTLTLVTIFLSLALGTINLILPMAAINQALFPLPQSSKSQVKYSAIQEKFEVTYEMNNPAYKTDRQRRNVKDILGLGIDQEDTKAVAIEMANFFMGNLVTAESRQPLLKDTNRQKNQQNIEYSLLLNDLITDRQFQANNNQNNTSMTHSGGPIPLNNSFESSGNDPRKQLKSIKRQLQSKEDPPAQNNQQKSQSITHNNPPLVKSNAPSASTANDSLLKRTITDKNPQKKQSYTERKEVVEGQPGEKFNISVLEPPQAKNNKKIQTKPLQIINDESPQAQFILPQQKPSKEETKPFQLQKKPQNTQKQVPYRNSHDQTPLTTKRPPQPMPETPSNASPMLEPDTGLYTPLVHSEQFKFQDPTKQKQSRYDPHLIENSQEKTPQGRYYLNGEGIMKALGRPFTSFVKKMEVEAVTERNPKKRDKKQGERKKQP